MTNAAQTADFCNTRSRRQGGVALVVSMILLVVGGIMALSMMETVMRDRQVVGFQKARSLAVHTAESGASLVLSNMRVDISEGDWPLATGFFQDYGENLAGEVEETTLGQVSEAMPTLPRFQADPTSGYGAVRYIGVTNGCPSIEIDMRIKNYGSHGLGWGNTLWDIRLQGRVGRSAVSRVQTMAGRCQAFRQT